ncbi:MAG: hypothetical protein WA728_09370 [Xanthobacteraceae bacterium]
MNQNIGWVMSHTSMPLNPRGWLTVGLGALTLYVASPSAGNFSQILELQVENGKASAVRSAKMLTKDEARRFLIRASAN